MTDADNKYVLYGTIDGEYSIQGRNKNESAECEIWISLDKSLLDNDSLDMEYLKLIQIQTEQNIRDSFRFYSDIFCDLSVEFKDVSNNKFKFQKDSRKDIVITINKIKWQNSHDIDMDSNRVIFVSQK